MPLRVSNLRGAGGVWTVCTHFGNHRDTPWPTIVPETRLDPDRGDAETHVITGAEPETRRGLIGITVVPEGPIAECVRALVTKDYGPSLGTHCVVGPVLTDDDLVRIFRGDNWLGGDVEERLNVLSRIGRMAPLRASTNPDTKGWTERVYEPRTLRMRLIPVESRLRGTSDVAGKPEDIF
jgi:hypothetical protein